MCAEESNLLGSIDSPADLKRLTFPQLEQLAGEIRQLLIETVSNNGGHLASNLGAVELTLALHRVFCSPTDQIIWDVGHQSYVHKIVTGRRTQFGSIRQKNGLAGYPKVEESEHDIFIAGHSSTSISAAIGMAQAKIHQNRPGKVIAVIGDGSFTNGMVYEALNNVQSGGDRLIILFNDNEMAISKNVGAFARHLAKIRSNPRYFRAKDRLRRFLGRIPLAGRPVYRGIESAATLWKQSLYHTNLFENVGLYYLGPVDGHNLNQLCDVLNRAKEINRPVLVHVETLKGKGYPFAEAQPELFHGVPAFQVETGNPDISAKDSYSSVFGEHLAAMAEKDPRICAITAAMTCGTGLQLFAQRHPERFYDVGIAESHGLTFSAGLAANGMRPFFAVYSTFLQRGVDQLLHDIAIDRQPVVIGVDRAGIVGEDGETHQGLFDVALTLPIPHLTIDSPATYEELRCTMEQAMSEEGPHIIRYPRGSQPATAFSGTPKRPFHLLRQRPVRGEILFVTYGRTFFQAEKACGLLKEQGIQADLLKILRIRPLEEKIFSAAMDYPVILFAEEGILQGGVGELLEARLLERGYQGKILLRGVEDRYLPHSSVQEALEDLGLDGNSLALAAEELLGLENRVG